MILVYLVMLITMRSFIGPSVIVFSLPFASIVALAALFITQRTLGLPALIGMLMLKILMMVVLRTHMIANL